jgi:cytochrome c biogenesis factor
MALKLLKGIWFVSMVLALGTLLYVYAGLPQDVVVQSEGGDNVSISNEAFFYVVMMLLAISNVMVFVTGKLFQREEDFKTWFYGLIATLNIFFVIALIYISQFNSNERFDYGRVAFLIYGSVGLIVLWAALWPGYLIYRRLKSKPTV